MAAPLTVLACAFGATAQSRTAAAASGSPAIQFLRDSASTHSEPVQQIGPLREGYTTLWWTPVAEASVYRLHDASGEAVYVGHLPQAFLSGLPDGEYRFSVSALSASGDVLATTGEAVVVYVEHWNRALAWTLSATGGAVMAALVIVLALGSWLARAAGHRQDDSAIGPTAEGGEP